MRHTTPPALRWLPLGGICYHNGYRIRRVGVKAMVLTHQTTCEQIVFADAPSYGALVQRVHTYLEGGAA